MPETVKSLLKKKGFDVWSVDPVTSVFDAIQLMSEKGIGAVLVLENERMVGIMSERDYTRKVILMDRSSKATRVDEIMTSKVLYVETQRTVDECMALMTKRRVRHLPVMEDGRVVGMISIGDVVKAMIAAKSILIDQLERYIAGH